MVTQELKGPFDPDKRVLIPVVLRKGRWHPFYGGEMPKLREGTVAEITVEESSFLIKDEIQRFNAEETVTILPGGSLLWATMSPYHGMGGPGIGVPDGVKTRPEDRIGKVNLVQFKIGEDLKLRTRGTKQAQLEPCKCELDGFSENEEVLSINQAYSRLSERFEVSRKSHSGNVFSKIFFIDGELLLPLDVLRAREAVKYEKRLFGNAV